MKRLASSMLLIVIAGTAQAKDEVAVQPEEFEQIVTGRVLEYHVTGSSRLVGYESYLPGRKTIFRYGDGSCVAGHWYPKSGEICFVYDTEPKPNCIRYVRRGKTFAAHDPRQDGTTDHFDIKIHNGMKLACSGG